MTGSARHWRAAAGDAPGGGLQGDRAAGSRKWLQGTTGGEHHRQSNSRRNEILHCSSHFRFRICRPLRATSHLLASYPQLRDERCDQADTDALPVSEPEFLNVDLELESGIDLSPLAEHLGDSVCVLFRGRVADVYRLALETNCVGASGSTAGDISRDADECIREFVSLVVQLPPPLRALWDACASRVFDIGLATGTGPSALVQIISASTVHMISSVGGTIRVTLYPPPTGSNLTV
jgi:hypothetical protein